MQLLVLLGCSGHCQGHRPISAWAGSVTVLLQEASTRLPLGLRWALAAPDLGRLPARDWDVVVSS